VTSASRRLKREMKTVHAMIALSCGKRHEPGHELCSDCGALWDYARSRVEHCPFKECKPACSECTVHCYKPSMRDRIRDVMRYAGPRMVWRHPLLAFWHILKGRKAPPVLRKKPAADAEKEAQGLRR
jgi:ribosomal protein L32